MDDPNGMYSDEAMMYNANDYVMKPGYAGAVGPDGYVCWIISIFH